MSFNQNRLNQLIQAYARRIGGASGMDEQSLPYHSRGIGQFSISPPQETALRLALMEENWFLPLLTNKEVAQIRGQVVDVGNPGLFTGRADGTRFSKNIGVSGNTYDLVAMDSCARMPWEMLADWIHSGTTEDEFVNTVATFILRSFANDIVRTGFNGTHAAKVTDAEKNPNGEDIAIGWHQIAKNFDELHEDDSTPEEDRIPGFTPRVLNPGEGSITLGPNGDIKTLDALASWVISTTIPAQFQNNPDVVLLVGHELVAAEQFRLFQEAGKPTENIAAQMLANTVAGRRVHVAPFLPGKRIAATTLQNLQVLTQRGTQQRRAEHVQDRMGYENAWWRMSGYALGHPMMYGAIDDNVIVIEEEEAINDFGNTNGGGSGEGELDKTQV